MQLPRAVSAAEPAPELNATLATWIGVSARQQSGELEVTHHLSSRRMP